MKKQYKLLLTAIIAEFFIVSMLDEANIKTQSWIGNAIGVFICFLPIQILLFLLSKDEAIGEKKRKCIKIAFWYINICYLLGGVATLILS